MIDRDELLETLTDEDVINIMQDLGSDGYIPDGQGNYYFQTVCHGGDSYKLIYYTDTKILRCFTCCNFLSLYDVIIGALGLQNDSEGFKQAFNYVCNYKGIKNTREKRKSIVRGKKKKEDEDMVFLKLHKIKRTDNREIKQFPACNDSILNMFDDYYPNSWYEEGISPRIAQFFEIKMYISQRKAIIPHRDYYGNLVGIRVRNFKEELVNNNRKYMPLTIEKFTYKYPMNFNLYGIYQNKKNIKLFKKVIIFESEKSVLHYASIYGQENNIALATCGMTLSNYQIFLLLSLGVNEIIIAYDKQYELDKLDYYENKENNNISFTEEEKVEHRKKKEEYNGYFKRIIKAYSVINGRSNLSVISCFDNRLDYKDAPIDKGKQVFEELYNERYMVTNTEELEAEML